MRKDLFLFFLLSWVICSCAGKSAAPKDHDLAGPETDAILNDEDLSVADELLPDDAPPVVSDPRPPDWGDCTGGWEQKEQINEQTGRLEARWCEPPADWRPAAPPDWGDCPEGWEPKEEKDEAGDLLAKYCEPILPPEETVCPPGYFALFGSTECQRIGAECPAGEFADIPADAGTEIVYVSEGGSIQAAIDAAPEGAVIALGKGTFDEIVTIVNKGVTLWGACVEETILTKKTHADAGGYALLNLEGNDATGTVVVRDLSVSDTASENLWGISVDGGTAELKGVSIDRATIGIFVAWKAHLYAENVLIADMMSEEDGTKGMGLWLYQAEATLARTVIERTRWFGILADHFDSGRESVLTATDLIVRDTRSRVSDKTAGYGITLQGNTRATLSRVLLERNREIGLFAIGTAIDATIEFSAADLIVRGTEPMEYLGTDGAGIHLQGYVTATLDRTLVADNRTVGLSALAKPPTQVQLVTRDLIVSDTSSQQSDKNFGLGMDLQENVTADMTRTALIRNRSMGLSVHTINNTRQAILQMTDAFVYGTLPQESDLTGGRGIQLENHVSALFRRVVITNNADIGIFVDTPAAGSEATVTIEDGVISDTVAQASDGMGGRGLNIQNETTADLARVVMERNRDVGLFIVTVNEGTHASLTAADLIVRDTRSRGNDGTAGRGMSLQNNVAATLGRVLVERNRELGMLVATSEQGVALTLDATDLVVRDTRSQDSDKQWGAGMLLQDGVSGTIRRAFVDGNREAGIIITGDPAAGGAPQMDLIDIVISHTAIRECFELGIDCGYAPEAAFGYGMVAQGTDGTTAVTLTDVAILDNETGLQIKGARVFAGDTCTLPFGLEEGKTACIHLVDNETALNAFSLPEDYDPNAAFAEFRTWYDGNELNFSGDPQAVPEPPDPTDPFEDGGK